jgi:hypothetical protein
VAAGSPWTEGNFVAGLFYDLTRGMAQRRFPAPWSMREIPGGYLYLFAKAVALFTQDLENGACQTP